MSSQALRWFRRFGGLPSGRWLFSKLICRRAPYFATIAPRVEVLEPGRCIVQIRDRRAVHNHIGTVHAIALCNMAELAAGLATDVTIPDSARWIPKGMTVRYLAKARGTLTATATVPSVADAGVAQELQARVEVRDIGSTIVFEAEIAMWVSPRKT